MNREDHKIKNIWIILIIAVIVVIIVASVTGLSKYVQKTVHDERITYLEAQTSTTASLIREMIENHMNHASICAEMISRGDYNGKSITDILEDTSSISRKTGLRVILIDENTTWHSENFKSGKITAPEYYGSETADELVYITQGVGADVESIVYRVRLKNPVTVTTGKEEVTIGYCSLIYYMDSFRTDLKDAFPYECNSFITDETGLMLYKNFPLSRLINGTNLFAKYTKVDFLYGDTGEAQLQSIYAGNPTAGEFSLDGSNYYICCSTISVNDWYVAFVLDSQQIVAGNYIGTITGYIGIVGILIIFLLLIVITIFLMGRNNRIKLDAQKKANELLSKASNAKSVFVSNMSHDIRTPINGIIGMTAMAKKEDNPPRTKECLDRIDTSSKYLLSLVNDVLDMSVIEDGRLVISEGSMDIKAFMDDCAAIVSSQVADKNIDFITDYTRVDHPHVLADEVHLRQVIINILGNACKFTPQGGRISFICVETGSKDGGIENRISLRFEIKDNGIGMSEEFQKTIWNRFTQERDPARKEMKGTGLGMAITKNIVDAMEGTVTVDSHIGEGSTFIVEIEVKQDLEKKDVAGAHVLLAEDNEINMEIAKDILESRGVTADCAADGSEAVSMFAQVPPFTYDVIFMDIMMPGMNGLEAARAIRASGREDALTVPIIAMTANSSERDVTEAKEAGMTDYTGKPLVPERLIGLITHYRGGAGQ